jgi:hypothetical protein
VPRDENGNSRPGFLGALRQAVSGGTAFGGRDTVPDAVALSRQQRLGHPGPWPDALLSLLAGFREHVPPAAREPGA